ncbi:hypothetical protein MNB_SV-12-2014 [hydrothermal vent metagenome]|uniref:Uncharacterized protein n=1 Tax=hydrothermal vent metagenome TaxID=652676 RepID=A0A1W1BUS5_9ZZZZ
MVYVEENIENQKLNKIVNAMSNNDLVIFSHTRHFWKEKHFTEEHIKKDGLKGLDKLIIGYSEFIKNNPTAKPLLVFFEYGSDVDASKELIAKLNIDKYVMWLSLMARKDILQLINHSDIVVDALGATMWGGVGWEALASGKIFMQNIVQTDKEYYDEMGHNIPFLMRAKSAIDVEKHLTNFIKNREYYLKKSEDNREWFNKYAGIGLAKEYKEIVKELYFQK